MFIVAIAMIEDHCTNENKHSLAVSRGIFFDLTTIAADTSIDLVEGHPSFPILLSHPSKLAFTSSVCCHGDQVASLSCRHFVANTAVTSECCRIATLLNPELSVALSAHPFVLAIMKLIYPYILNGSFFSLVPLER